MKTAIRIIEGLVWVAAYFAVVIYFNETSELAVLICGLGITIYAQIKGHSPFDGLVTKNTDAEGKIDEVNYLDYIEPLPQYDDLPAKISRALMSGLIGLWVWYFLQKSEIEEIVKWIIILISVHTYLVILEMLRLARLRPISGLEASYQALRLIILFAIALFAWKNSAKLHDLSLLFLFVIYALDRLGGFLLGIHEKLDYFRDKFRSKKLI